MKIKMGKKKLGENARTSSKPLKLSQGILLTGQPIQNKASV